jgi:hypothetical protein
MSVVVLAPHTTTMTLRLSARDFSGTPPAKRQRPDAAPPDKRSQVEELADQMPSLDYLTRDTCRAMMKRADHEMRASPLRNLDPVAHVFARAALQIINDVTRLGKHLRGPMPKEAMDYYLACLTAEAMKVWRQLAPSDHDSHLRLESAFPFLAFTEMGSSTAPFQLPSDEQLNQPSANA